MISFIIHAFKTNYSFLILWTEIKIESLTLVGLTKFVVELFETFLDCRKI